MNEPSRIVGLGEVLWDILPDGSGHLGGAPMNVAVHAQTLGCSASVISAVGGDELGREAIQLLSGRHRLDVSAVAVLPDRPTGAVDVRIKDGQPTYEFRADVAWDFLELTDVARRAMQSADAVVFGSLAQRNDASRRTIEELLTRTRPECLKVFDVNLRPPFYDNIVLGASLARANVLKLNDEELPVVLAALNLIAGPDWVSQLFKVLPELRMVALTRGAQGSTLYAPEEPGHTLPAWKVAVRDTVGAGDAFTAALVVGLLKGWTLDAIHDRAVAAAAFVCSQAGATPRLPAEILAGAGFSTS